MFIAPLTDTTWLAFPPSNFYTPQHQQPYLTDLTSQNLASENMQAVEHHVEDIATFMTCIPWVMTFVLLAYTCISFILDYRTWIAFCKYGLAESGRCSYMKVLLPLVFRQRIGTRLE